MFNILKRFKVVPVAIFKNIESVAPCLVSLERGGLPLAEITFRTSCAEEAIKVATKLYPHMFIGAGTVVEGEQCERALRAGAKFIVSPGLSEEIARICCDAKIPYIPGIATATEIMQALSLGLVHLKFFPSEALGGLNMIRSLSAAFPQVNFLPTGGINQNNLKEYLSCPFVFACGGTWMLGGTSEDIEEKTKQAVELTKEI